MIVLDTHVLICWLAESPGLSAAAKRLITKQCKTGRVIASAISVLEIVTAVRRGRLEFAVPIGQWLADMRSIPELHLEPVSADIAVLAGNLPEAMHGDPADRLIAATAILLGMPLVTGNEKLRANANLQTIW